MAQPKHFTGEEARRGDDRYADDLGQGRRERQRTASMGEREGRFLCTAFRRCSYASGAGLGSHPARHTGSAAPLRFGC